MQKTTVSTWIPPAGRLENKDGLWRPQTVSPVSYPNEGNDFCFQVEDASYWFGHRNSCIQAVVRNFPPAGTFYDIGGGNGFVALGLQRAGLEVVLLEPGNGARNAHGRGLQNVIHAALDDVGFDSGSLPAAGAFDVVEHIEDDVGFLGSIRRYLKPGGRFYATVPAGQALWSDEDVHAGHYRRYSPASLARSLRRAGFDIEFISPFFTWLVPLVFTLRALRYRLRGPRPSNYDVLRFVKNDHTLPKWLRIPVAALHAWELSRLRARRMLPWGTSLLCVARAPQG